MRKRGSIYEYKKEMEQDLMRVYREKLSEYLGNGGLEDVFRAMTQAPASRFWVSEERTFTVISAMMKNSRNVRGRATQEILFSGKHLEGFSQSKKKMYMEIYGRVKEWRRQRPHDSLITAVSKVIMQPAPCFYMTQGTIRRTVYKIKRRWYEERRHKLKHIFM